MSGFSANVVPHAITHPFALAYMRRWTNKKEKGESVMCYTLPKEEEEIIKKKMFESDDMFSACRSIVGHRREHHLKPPCHTKGKGEERGEVNKEGEHNGHSVRKNAVVVPSTLSLPLHTREWFRTLHAYAPLSPCTMETSNTPAQPHLVGDGKHSDDGKQERNIHHQARTSSIGEAGSGGKSSLSWESFDSHGNVVVVESVEKVEDLFGSSMKQDSKEDEVGDASDITSSFDDSNEREVAIQQTLHALQGSMKAYRSRYVSPPSSAGASAAEPTSNDDSSQARPFSLVSLVVLTGTILQTCVERSTALHATTRRPTSLPAHTGEPSSPTAARTLLIPIPTNTATSSLSAMGRSTITTRLGKDPPSVHPLPVSIAFSPFSPSSFTRTPPIIPTQETPPRGSLPTRETSSSTTTTTTTVYCSFTAAAATLLHLLSQEVIQKELRQLVWAFLRHRHQYLEKAGMELAALLQKAQAIQDHHHHGASSSSATHGSAFSSSEPPRWLHLVAPTSWEQWVSDCLCFSKRMIQMDGKPITERSSGVSSSPPLSRNHENTTSTMEGVSRGADRAPHSTFRTSYEQVQQGKEREENVTVEAWTLPPQPPPPVQKQRESTYRKVPTHPPLPSLDGYSYPRIEVCSPHHGHHFHFVCGVKNKDGVRQPATVGSASSSSSFPFSSTSQANAFVAWMGRPSTSDLWQWKKVMQDPAFTEKGKAVRGGEDGSGQHKMRHAPSPSSCWCGGLRLEEVLTLWRRLIEWPIDATTPPSPSGREGASEKPGNFLMPSSLFVLLSFTSCGREALWVFLSEVAELRIALAYFFHMELLLQEVKDFSMVSHDMNGVIGSDEASREFIRKETEDAGPEMHEHRYQNKEKKHGTINALDSALWVKMEADRFQLVADILRFVHEESEETSRLLVSSRHWGRLVRKARWRNSEEEARLAVKEMRKPRSLHEYSSSTGAVGRNPSFQAEESSSSMFFLRGHEVDSVSRGGTYSSIEEVFKGLVDACKERRNALRQFLTDSGLSLA